MIGDHISIMIVDIRGDKVRVGIEAPDHVAIYREEVYRAIRREQVAAAALGSDLVLPGGPGHAVFTIERVERTYVVIRDQALADCKTVTNDAEHVVARLTAAGIIQDSKRLYYYDSDSELAEIRHADGRFVCFQVPAALPARR